MSISTSHNTLGAGPGAPAFGGSGLWFEVLRRYVVFVAIVHPLWEMAQVPLYTIWSEGTPGEIAFAILHCSAGDVLIAGSSLIAALLLVGNRRWPSERYGAVGAVTFLGGLGYTVFSEWLNTEIRGSWAYAAGMPTLPLIGSGVSPLAQWIVIPLAAFWWAHRPFGSANQPKETDA